MYFGLHTQRCCSWSQTPLLAVHLFGQIGMWQASPVNWASQVHTESIQMPCPEHSLEEVVLGHVFKLKCFLHKFVSFLYFFLLFTTIQCRTIKLLLSWDFQKVLIICQKSVIFTQINICFKQINAGFTYLYVILNPVKL